MNDIASAGPGPLIGQEIFGTYKLVEVLGRGGMAVVYKGQHLLTDQAVAIKVLPPDLADQPQVKARFIDEARTLARLEHPNIVTMHNFLEDAGHLYLIMQFAEGDTFDQIIEREGRVSAADVVAIGIETLKALEYAHGQGVIHRDIKPSNIIIRGDSSVKVMDFGIAKIVGSTKLTVTGQTMGTVRFMSPEQVRGKQVDHRSDLYSLGVSLYQAVVGRTPYDGETHFEIMRKHLSELPPPPSEFVELPAELEQALLRVLEKRVEARFQSAKEFRQALEAIPVDATTRTLTRSIPTLAAVDSTAGRPFVTPGLSPLPRRRKRPWHLVTALTLVVLAVAVLLWALLSEGPGGGALRSPVKRGAPAGQRDAGPGRPASRWPKLHRVAQGLKFASDVTFAADRLRVMSARKQAMEPILALYRRARGAYLGYLKQEGIALEVPIGALNLVLVPQRVLNSPAHWTGVKPNVDYPTRYFAPTGTLYVHDGPRNVGTDLPYGFGLHFCARIAQLSNSRCQELAEGFEQFLRKAGH